MRTKRAAVARGPRAAAAKPIGAGSAKPSRAARRQASADSNPLRAIGAAAVRSATAAASSPTVETLAAASQSPDPGPAAVAGAAAALGAVPAAVLGAVPAPAASAAGTCSLCKAFTARPGSLSASRNVTATLRGAALLDGVGHWLSGLPASPVTTFLSGALQLVRRNLFQDVPIVHVSDVTVSEGNNAAVFTVTLDKPFTSTLAVGYKTASVSARPGAEPGDLETGATAGSDYQDTSGILTFAPGQTSQQVSVTCLDDHTAETAESFSLEILAVIASPAAAPASAQAASSAPSAAQVGEDRVTPVVLASATATIVDDECVKIDVNPNFAYGDALLASVFSDLAYNHRTEPDFSSQVQATGWEGIGISPAGLGANGYSPAAGGYGVQDGLSMQSYAFAGKRTAADGTVQFVVSFEGSNSPTQEPADWVVNAGQYGWSRYYASLEPLMTEVVGQMLQAQSEQKKTQLILTGHSLGGASAMMAFADLLAPQGNLWPNTTSVLPAGQRVLDTVGGWSPEIRTALLAATSVYTFGAPSILIEPTKPGVGDVVAFAAAFAASGVLGAVKLLFDAVSGLTVDNKKLPDLTGIAGINFSTRVFQFEHANTSWLPPYPGDIVAQIGSRDPGTVLAVNLDNDIHTAYAGWLSLVPGATHPISLYRESVLRLITNSNLLKSPNDLAGATPQLTPTSAGKGSDGRNDFFVNLSDSGKAGNDVFAYSQAGQYSPDGGAGTDTYSVSSYNIALTIDGAVQSGRDSLVFNLAGTPGATYSNTGSGALNDTAVFSVTGADGKSSTVTIIHWDQWQISDVFQVISPADGQWTLNQWTIDSGPVVAATPANEIPLSVV